MATISAKASPPSLACEFPHPQFEGQTKTKLGNSEVDGIVSGGVGEQLAKYFEENPRVAQSIVRKGMLAAEAREAARKAKDSTADTQECAGRRRIARQAARLHQQGIATNANSTWSKVIRPVVRPKAVACVSTKRFCRCVVKIINAYKSREAKVLENAEVQSMIQAIGTGIGADQDLSKRRYGKIIVMTDADVDGSHIRTLLLCFFLSTDV